MKRCLTKGGLFLTHYNNIYIFINLIKNMKTNYEDATYYIELKTLEVRNLRSSPLESDLRDESQISMKKRFRLSVAKDGTKIEFNPNGSDLSNSNEVLGILGYQFYKEITDGGQNIYRKETPNGNIVVGIGDE